MSWARLFDEDLAQARLAEGIVLQVEAVEAMESVLVRMHVQRVHIQVIPAQHTVKVEGGNKEKMPDIQ